MFAAEISNSDLFRKFLTEFPTSIDSEEEGGVVASMRLLQSFPESMVFVKKGAAFELAIPVHQENSIVAWQFRISKYDIGFVATFEKTEVVAYRRLPAQRSIHGEYVCDTTGLMKLTWDNSYSWRRSKQLYFRAEVLDSELLEATSMIAIKSATSVSKGVAMPVLLSDTDSNSTDQSSPTRRRRKSYLSLVTPPSPIKLVGSTLSLLGIGRKKSVNAELDYVSGYLLIRLGKSFLRRDWHRKWFSLNIASGTLRYYAKVYSSSQQHPQRTVLLGKKNAALSIVPGTKLAPTQYCFTLRTGRKVFELCAETVSDYEKWREALSSTILFTELSKTESFRRECDAFESSLLDVDVDEYIDDESEDDEEEDEDEILLTSSSASNILAPISMLTIPKANSSTKSKFGFILLVNIILVLCKVGDMMILLTILVILNTNIYRNVKSTLS